MIRAQMLPPLARRVRARPADLTALSELAIWHRELSAGTHPPRVDATPAAALTDESLERIREALAARRQQLYQEFKELIEQQERLVELLRGRRHVISPLSETSLRLPISTRVSRAGGPRVRGLARVVAMALVLLAPGGKRDSLDSPARRLDLEGAVSSTPPGPGAQADVEPETSSVQTSGTGRAVVEPELLAWPAGSRQRRLRGPARSRASPTTTANSELRRAASLLAARDVLPAITILRDYLQRRPSDPEALRLLAVGCLLVGQEAEAAAALTELLVVTPDPDAASDARAWLADYRERMAARAASGQWPGGG